MEKYVKNGMVAVLVSPGYGAGWSSWGSNNAEVLAMYRRFVELVLEGDRDGAAELAEQLFPNFYTGGAGNLEVEWVPVGTAFRIDEYDGSESLIRLDQEEYMTA